MERKVHHRKKDVEKREKEATNIRCKKLKGSGECETSSLGLAGSRNTKEVRREKHV